MAFVTGKNPECYNFPPPLRREEGAVEYPELNVMLHDTMSAYHQLHCLAI